MQQLAVSCIAHGYLFYVTGRITEGKDPDRTDAKLIAQYGLDVSKSVFEPEFRSGTDLAYSKRP